MIIALLEVECSIPVLCIVGIYPYQVDKKRSTMMDIYRSEFRIERRWGFTGKEMRIIKKMIGSTH